MLKRRASTKPAFNSFFSKHSRLLTPTQERKRRERVHEREIKTEDMESRERNKERKMQWAKQRDACWWYYYNNSNEKWSYSKQQQHYYSEVKLDYHFWWVHLNVDKSVLEHKIYQHLLKELVKKKLETKRTTRFSVCIKLFYLGWKSTT